VVRERREPRGANNLWEDKDNSILVSNRPPFTKGRKEHIILAGTNQARVFDAAVRMIGVFKFEQGGLLAKEPHGAHLF